MAADNSRRRKALVPQRLLAEHFADAVDWHDLAALVDRGCPIGLALEIVRSTWTSET